jgi:murein DD-endopeptidase MepM/ murein hydrolase activator NlpD
MSRHSRSTVLVFLFATAILTACQPATATPESFPTYDPFVPLNGTAPAIPIDAGNQPDAPTRTPGPTPTRAQFSVTLPTPRDPNAPLVTPTPDMPHALPTPRQDADQYVVQAGDTLGDIAARYGVSAEALMQANNLADPNALSVGQTLLIPAPEPGAVGSSFKIVPDSELVNGPAAATFDMETFVQEAGGYLANYTQEVNGETLTGAQVIQLVAANYSVNPRLLLALLEYRSEWVSNPAPAEVDYPLGFRDQNRAGLYRQLTWAANELNRGYYLWRANAVSSWVLGDGSVVPVDPTINAGTAGVQNFLSRLNDRATWEKDVSPFGVFQTYYFLFGNPFERAIEPLVPPSLNQPRMQLPFDQGVTWAFTGGPHGGWDSGSAWAALDFGPIGDTAGCTPSPNWVAAVADGLIVRAANGAVIQDLDNDGYEQTGWTVLYMHVDTNERVEPGSYLFAGDHIGHPSCEGGISNGTHLHLARKYNGEWIAADGHMPFVLDGWTSSGDGSEYGGYLTRGTQKMEAYDGVNEQNQISR